MVQIKGEPTEYIDFLRNNRQSFKVRKTSGTTIVTNSSGSKRLYYKDDLLSLKDFGFMSKIRRRIKDSDSYKALVKAMDAQGQSDAVTNENLMLKRSKQENMVEFGISPLAVRYFDFDDSVYSLDLETGCCYDYENIKECDITMAYYYAAFQLGAFDAAFLKECQTLPKPTRLKMLGVIAANVTIYEYTDGKKTNCYVMNDKYLRAIWFSICRYVDQCMRDIKNFLVKDFIFYWVDGIFFKDNALAEKTIESIMKAYGFEYYIISDITKMYAENRNGNIVLCLEKKNGDKPVFNIPKSKVRGYYLGDPVESYVVNGEKLYIE